MIRLEVQNELFSNNLNHLIKLSGKTQKQIAADLDIPRTTLSTWCIGRNVPNLITLRKLAEYFNCSISDLIEKQAENFDDTYQLKIIIEKPHDPSFIRRLLAYAKFIEANPEEK